MGLDEAVGGLPAPAMLTWAIGEFALGAQPAAYICHSGPVLSDIIYSPRQRTAEALGVADGASATGAAPWC